MMCRSCWYIWVDKKQRSTWNDFKKLVLKKENRDNTHNFPIEEIKDFSVSGRYFHLAYNEKWEMLETLPKPSEVDLPKYYLSEDYISHTDSQRSIFEKIYRHVKKLMLDKKLKWILDETKFKGKLLDLGAGTGDFMLHAKEKEWEVAGVEPNPCARDLAEKKGIQLQPESGLLPSQDFDVISMWHVLEHVPNLEIQIQELNRLLKKDGTLVVAVPNFKSYDAQKYGGFWAAFDVPRHLWHFSQESIASLFEAHGFQLIKTKPLLFDSYYVSLLSEKYKTGNQNWLPAIWNGLRSNWKARKTGEYSSLVYFLQKK